MSMLTQLKGVFDRSISESSVAGNEQTVILPNEPILITQLWNSENVSFRIIKGAACANDKGPARAKKLKANSR